MKLFTRFDMMRGIPARLRESYCSRTDEKRRIADRIDSIPDSEFTRQSVRDAMAELPHDWTINRCDECREDHEFLVHFGDEPDYDMRWQYLCLSCLEKAVELAKSANVQPSDG